MARGVIEEFLPLFFGGKHSFILRVEIARTAVAAVAAVGKGAHRMADDRFRNRVICRRQRIVDLCLLQNGAIGGDHDIALDQRHTATRRGCAVADQRRAVTVVADDRIVGMAASVDVNDQALVDRKRAAQRHIDMAAATAMGLLLAQQIVVGIRTQSDIVIALEVEATGAIAAVSGCDFNDIAMTNGRVVAVEIGLGERRGIIRGQRDGIGAFGAIEFGSQQGNVAAQAIGEIVIHVIVDTVFAVIDTLIDHDIAAGAAGGSRTG